MNRPVDMPIGERLVQRGLITQDQLRIVLTEQKHTSELFGKLVVRLGFVSERALNDAMSDSTGESGVDLSNVIVDASALQLVPKAIAQRSRSFPVAYDEKTRKLTLAMSEPQNIVALDLVRAEVGRNVEIQSRLAGESEIIRCIDQHYGYELSIDGVLNEIETGEIDYQSLQNSSEEYSHPVVRLVDAIFADAVQRDASDIHLEPESGFIRIRYRIDGVLRQVRSLHDMYWAAIVIRIKVMSGMNIAETRTPQDGRLSLTLSGRPVDFRVAVQPTVHGENIVLRVLDRQKGIVALDRLGLHEDIISSIHIMLARPEGIILVTGPTGSGKTTTLYSILNHMNTEGVNIMTLEDPVEYPMPMIRQTSVNESAKMDFASGIRSMMRQDPDIILVGEIRDQDTAEMAFRAAMTGHQVFSTLHTNSAIGAIPRLLDIGIVPDVMAGNIIGIVAQRLLRRLCLKCRQPHEAESFERELLGLTEDKPVTIYSAKGCDACDHQGYKGRLSVLEVLRLDSDLDDLISRRGTFREVKDLALSKGFQTLADDAIRRVIEGVVSLEEVARVIDLTERV